jgi:hypothetical protein
MWQGLVTVCKILVSIYIPSFPDSYYVNYSRVGTFDPFLRVQEDQNGRPTVGFINVNPNKIDVSDSQNADLEQVLSGSV